jgi:hypothetical protein
MTNALAEGGDEDFGRSDNDWDVYLQMQKQV